LARFVGYACRTVATPTGIEGDLGWSDSYGPRSIANEDGSSEGADHGSNPAIDEEAGRFETDDDAPSESGIALVEDRIQRVTRAIGAAAAVGDLARVSALAQELADLQASTGDAPRRRHRTQSA
jgi:hypothetical protein